MSGIFSEYKKQIVLAATSTILALGFKHYLATHNHDDYDYDVFEPQQEDEGETEDVVEYEDEGTLDFRKPETLWNTGLFFPDYDADKPDSTTQQFLWYFQQAQKSIRVCIYTLSFPELKSLIYQQHKRGLQVQFVVARESLAKRLRKYSIPCGVYPRDPNIPATDQLMHHKFAVIDDEAVLVGSMNWTMEGILSTENILVSTNSTLVKRYSEEFFRLMSICKNAKAFY